MAGTVPGTQDTDMEEVCSACLELPVLQARHHTAKSSHLVSGTKIMLDV